MEITKITQAIVVASLVMCMARAADRPDRIGSIEVEGTVFRIERTGGQPLSGPTWSDRR